MEEHPKSPIIFTDLDGTLLDHQSYSFSPAERALKTIEEGNIPLIMNSSKTAAEIIALQKTLNINQPFISENGAAVYQPSQQTANGRTNLNDFGCKDFARPRGELLEILNQLREQHGYQFTGFSDCNVSAISDLTGLSPDQASLALERSYSEPLLWHDDASRKAAFLEQLKLHNLIAQQGGRFLTITTDVNKAEAMAWVCQQYKPPLCVIALGDGPNDLAMLNAADIAVVIKSKYSEQLIVDGASQVIRTRLAGPAGWQAAMDDLLPLFIASNSKKQH